MLKNIAIQSANREHYSREMYGDHPSRLSQKRPAGPLRADSRDSEIYREIRRALAPDNRPEPFKRQRVGKPPRERVSRLSLLADWLWKLVGKKRRPSATDIAQGARG